ncbi:hypothetical protein [Mucilaginibacter gotjawali]|uniref:Uncharacterized protein n=2 Tax=Mucilaginibacter gotjawali TaxID=1550579 RepID=A0A839SPY7_9SPHI|nr:hypothetical protein [Mucilaginibacter gotjawali]MBB3058437.1 hypothetical protein [Mucilaginibacter gotjawali]BAU53734.1 hypothetical protein MgSA37_01904 [Mucilaginibacter gotjawali]
MTVILWLTLLQIKIPGVQTIDLSTVRHLYQRAPVVKQDAGQLNRLMLQVDSDTDAPVLLCYKGANEMIQAKYTLNPIIKLQKFNKGKKLIINAVNRDSLSLEIRFIRYSIQSNLPDFLGFHDELYTDKRFIDDNINNSKDAQLKEMIFNYLSAAKPDKFKL